jgi:hypothetical protein
VACQEAIILLRQNASIMPRWMRIGTPTSRNHRDGSRRAGASTPDGCDRRWRRALECCAAAGGGAIRRTLDRRHILRSRPVRSQSGGLVGRFFGRLPVVAFRIGPECISICLNDFTRPHWCGNYTTAPEKCGIGPESSNSMLRSPWVRGLLSLASAWSASARRPASQRSHAGHDAPGGTGCARPAACRTPLLPGELLAPWIAASRAAQFSRAMRPFSGAIAV